MKDLDPSTTRSGAPDYQIRLRGHLGRRWAEWFERWTIVLEEDGDTLLTGPVADQAALHGLLTRVRDLGMTIVSVMQVDSERTTPAAQDTKDDPPPHTPRRSYP